MGKTAQGIMRAFIVMGSVLLLTMPSGFAQTLWLETQQGEIGDTAAFTVWLDKALDAIDAFGFEIRYDSTKLQYTGTFIPEALSRQFDFFDVHEPQAGRIKVGGFTTHNRIEAGHSGRIVTLEFLVHGPGDATLRLENLVDDVAGGNSQAGLFEGPPMPPSDTSTSDGPSPSSSSALAPHTVQALGTSTVLSNPSPSTTAPTGETPEPFSSGSRHAIGTLPTRPLETGPEAPRVLPQPQPVGGKAHNTAAPQTKILPPSQPPPHLGHRGETGARRAVVAQPRQLPQHAMPPQPVNVTGERPESAQRLVVYTHDNMASSIPTFFSGAAFLGVLVLVFFQRKTLDVQKNALQLMQHELKRIVYTHNKTEQKFGEHAVQLFLSARLNALNTLMKLTHTKMQRHAIEAEYASYEASEVPEESLAQLDAYMHDIETLLKKCG